ncbi:MAG TPA: carboxypeptidase regulatory-like domain-containing protein [Kofleriaceae bacterium]|nr:carboxypeptidase regulatory-like domain-containing protein [Kofleriaceae bacterium]
MKKLVAALVVVAAVVIAFVMWPRERAHPKSTAPANAAGSATTAVTFRGTDGVERTLPAWMLSPGAPAKRIAGRVIFRGEPARDAIVELHSILSSTNLSAAVVVRTDANGHFDFGVRPAAAYDVTATRPDTTAAIQHVELANPTLTPASDRLELVLGECTNSIEGTVVDASNDPLPKARIRQNGFVGPETDAKGHYKLCVAFGDAELHYSADGYGSVVLTIDARGQMRRDVVLVPEATLDVTVVREDDAKPVEGALVVAGPMQWGPDRAGPSRGLTGADGRVRLGGLVPGRYHIFALGDDAQSSAPAEALAQVGVATDVVLKVAATARVTGHVVSGTKPVAGAEVTAVRKAPMGRSPVVFSQLDGSFTLDRVPAGDISFVAAPYEVESPASIAAAAGKSVDVTIKVHALGAIRGRVLRLGKPVPDVRVCCVQTIAGLRPDAITRADGTFEYRGVSAGEYDLQGGSDELGAFNMPVHVKLAAGEEKSVDLDLDMAGTITGTVVDKSGAPVPSVFVRWVHQTSGDLGRCMTNAKGEYRCGTMTGGGTYRAGVFPSSELQGVPYPTATGAPYPSVDVADAKTLVEGVTIAIDHAQQTISGRVIDDTGAPVVDVIVKAMPTGEAAPQFNSWLRLPMTSTDADGSFTLNELAPGQYALEAHAADGGEGMVTGVAAGAKSVAIKIERAGSITGTLVGFTKPPVVYATPQGPFKLFTGTVDGQSFRVTGLRPGRYTVNAQTAIEGDIQQVDVKAGQPAKVTLTSHGKGTIEGTVFEFRTKKPLGGATCRVVMQMNGEQSQTSWDPALAPKSDGGGRIVIDPAPAGPVSVICQPMGFKWSLATTDVTLTAGARATPQLMAVELTQDNPTSTGAQLDWRVTPPRIARVMPNTPAAAAGLLAGDLITAVDGVSVAGLCGSAVSVLISNTAANSDVKLTVQRGTATKTVSVKALHMPD